MLHTIVRAGTMSDQDAVALALTVWGVTLLATLVLGLIAYVVMSIATALFFRRVGVEPWKAWVPFYSLYTWLQVGGQNGHWMWLSLVPYGGIVTSVFLYIGMYRTGIAFGKGAGFLVLGIFLPLIWLLMLAFDREPYQPWLIAQRGYRPPFIGHGAVPA